MWRMLDFGWMTFYTSPMLRRKRIGMNSKKYGLLAGVTGSYAHRKTRFHTQRGEFVGFRGLAEYPALLSARLRAGGSTPWMTTKSVRALEAVLRPTSIVLELGSGRSTAWLAARAERVVSLEHDAEWSAA